MNDNSKTYTCICGKTFTNSQAFNGHQSHCQQHLMQKGTYNEYLYAQRNKAQSAHRASALKRKQRAEQKYEQLKLAWEAETHYCEKCGKELPRLYEERYGTGRFCSRACANSKPHTIESRNKISLALKGAGQPKYCKNCGKELNRRNKSGYCRSCISSAKERQQIRSNASKKSALKAKQNGTAVYWQSRNIMSYPEQFWYNVLNNNNIPIVGCNYSVKKADNKNCYFLDFYLEKNHHKIDLEIDGKQHTYPDRQQSDLVRDKYLKSLGYIVYRIPWNEINSDVGAKQMEEKIHNFLLFYASLQ